MCAPAKREFVCLRARHHSSRFRVDHVLIFFRLHWHRYGFLCWRLCAFASMFAWERLWYLAYVRACVCARVCMRVRLLVCVCVSVSAQIMFARSMCDVVWKPQLLGGSCSSWPYFCRGLVYFCRGCLVSRWAHLVWFLLRLGSAHTKPSLLWNCATCLTMMWVPFGPVYFAFRAV